MKNEIVCKDRYGGEHVLPRESVSFRIAVCAILQKDNKAFLIKDTSTNQYELPGGSIEVGETSEEALVRECEEEAGISVKELSLFTFRESRFYIRSKRKGYQALRLYFLVKLSDKQKQTTERKVNGSYLSFGDLSPENTNELSYDVLKQLFASSNT